MPVSSVPPYNPDLPILEGIEQNPELTQANLAEQLDVAVGTINWHLKRLIDKGYVKVRRLERRKLRYIITPEGIALRARLTLDFIQSSLNLYRLVRTRASDALDKIKGDGFHSVRIQADGDVAEITRLTCMEKGIAIVDEPSSPRLVWQGLKVFIDWGEKAK